MGKIEGIHIQNYGPLKSIKLGKLFSDQTGSPLGNMVTIIGPSGAGKSSMADAFGFIADCLDKGVEEACDLNNRGGFDNLVSQSSKEPIKFELYYRETSNSRPITYELSVALDKKERPFVQEERLRQRVEKRGRPKSFLHLQNGKGYAFEGREGWQDDEGMVSGSGKKVDVYLSDNRKLGIATYGAMSEYARIVDFMNFLKSWYLCYFSPDSARQVQLVAPQPFLDRTGGNLNNVAQYMYREDKSGFEKILKEIQTKLPDITKIEPSKTNDGRMVLRFLESGFSKPFYSSRMSDGTLKLFAYYLLLHEKTPRRLVFIEEPENGLYHHYLTELAGEMKRNVGKGFSKQLFITTHSPFFINALAPDDVWVLNKGEDGFSTLKRTSDYDYVQNMTEEEVLLGDLWYSKYFG
ncbi:MAG: AAA family ATPase [Firmicutes bacterium]|nr:AAA family ATPase [Bacillota bacterium]